MELRKGDILIFKGEGSFISKCISFFTDSDVSHAALLYAENTLAEMGSSGLGVNTITVTEDGRSAYVMRMKKKLDFQPVIDAADVYIEQGVEYDYPQLVLLAGLSCA